MKSNALVLAGFSLLIATAFAVVGMMGIRFVAAQVDATSSESVATSNDPVATDTKPVAPATDTASNSAETPAATDVSAPADTSSATPQQSGLVEVQLHCDQSYVGPLYDTASGHIEDTTSSTTVVNLIGEQAWTVCHDARGNVHEFKLTTGEYEALAVSGTPQKSVMEPADQAALDSFDDAAATTADAPADSSALPTASTDSTTTSPAQ